MNDEAESSLPLYTLQKDLPVAALQILDRRYPVLTTRLSGA
jgi:hypothetical protein